jgi:protein-arginine kinase
MFDSIYKCSDSEIGGRSWESEDENITLLAPRHLRNLRLVTVYSEVVEKIERLKHNWPENIALQSFDPAYFSTLSGLQQSRMVKCLNSGIENPDSQMGCYACHPADYDDLKPFFSKAISRYHQVPEDARQFSNWSLSGIEGLPEDGVLDLARLGLPALSMRIRTGRNLSRLPLPGTMSRADRIDLEDEMTAVFDKLAAEPGYGGHYYSLTPGNSSFINDAEYQDLVDQHLMFKNMGSDRFLKAAGISNDWPHGRGCYVSELKDFIIWVGEEDHLRIICMRSGTVLNEIFSGLRDALSIIESLKGMEFAYSPDYGVVTSCPTNLGTALRASVHIALPKLTADGTEQRVAAIAKPLGLSVRGVGGEHTPIGQDGTVDISPSARFHITEAEIMARLYTGITQLKVQEDNA